MHPTTSTMTTKTTKASTTLPRSERQRLEIAWLLASGGNRRSDAPTHRAARPVDAMRVRRA